MSRFLIVGAGGLIGRAVFVALPADQRRACSHHAGNDPTNFQNVDVVLFAGRDPDLGRPGFDPDATYEFVAARRAAERRIPFFSLGTGRVYAPSPEPWSETSALGPDNLYGEHKLALEKRLDDILGPLLTRLRIANVFGYEPGHCTFMGRMQRTLWQDNEIRFDMSPFTKRDFVPADLVGHWIGQLLRRPPGGTINLGSGIALECGRLALWLIEGFGRGRLIIEKPDDGNEFLMDIGLLRRLTNASITMETLGATTRALGVRLQTEGA